MPYTDIKMLLITLEHFVWFLLLIVRTDVTRKLFVRLLQLGMWTLTEGEVRDAAYPVTDEQ
jgi:hypothetical protein